MSSNRGPRTPRVWTDRWVRTQEHAWRPRHDCPDDDEHECPESRPEPAQTLWKRVARHNAERAEKGYSVFDWWSFDTFVCGVIANACRDFRLKGVGYPMGMTVEEWHEFLLGIETPLRAWAEDKFDVFGEDEQRMYEEAQAAMHRFADRLGNFWD